MLFSVNPNPSLPEFQELMRKTDIILNDDALKRPQYYVSRGGNPLEDDVMIALEESAKGTAFENTIEKISGQRFPDIIAAKYYGVEVKSTKDDHWTSTGSSILETTRVNGIERIYMTFGKLGGNPIQFLSKPYEDCLYDIAVTHMPRYRIDMRLEKGETIFDKIGIPYDELRKLDNPIAPVAEYYREQLKPGESLWWTGGNTDEAVSAKIRLWKNISTDEKRHYTLQGCVNYPEIFAGNYDRYALWLTSQGVVDPHIRDQFSAGGKEPMQLSSGSIVRFPAIFRRIKDNKDYFIRLMAIREPSVPVEQSPVKGVELSLRILDWCKAVSRLTPHDYDESMEALQILFFGLSNVGQPSTFSSERLVKCNHCHRTYGQSTTMQIPGLRVSEDDICPYCNQSNGSSLEYEYRNKK